MAPTLLEHDYIGLSGTQQPPPPPEADNDDQGLLTGTELTLGLPGNPPLLLLPKRKDTLSPVLTLGPPKGASGAKRGFSDTIAGSDSETPKGGLFTGVGNGVAKDGAATATASPMEKKGQASAPPAAAAGGADRGIAPAAKAQVVGWPPIRSYRKNTMAANPSKNSDDPEEKQDSSCLYVKVSMDGAPYLRKVDLKMYTNYKELSTGLDKMFSCFTAGQCGSHGAPGKDGLKENRHGDLRGSELVVTYEDKDGDWMLVGDVPWDMFTDSCRRLRIMKGSDAIGLAPRAMEKCKNKN